MNIVIKIVSRLDSSRVLYEHATTEERQAIGLAMRDALEAAVKSRANLSRADLRGAYLSGAYLSGADLSGANLSRADLRGAYLSGAYLSGADLSGANLSRADLRGAYLSGAYLSGADLRGAYLSGADLRGAYLSGADLSGADLSGADLSGADLSGANLSRADGEKTLLLGNRPYIGIGPIGSRSDIVSLWLTDSGALVRAGCFWGSLEKFEQAVKANHGENEHGREYAAAIALMRAHAEIWTPAKEIA